MKKWGRTVTKWIALALLVVAVPACAPVGNALTQKTKYDTLTPGWERKYTIQWQSQAEPGGTSLVYGQITSYYGEFALPFRVLAMAVNGNGQVIGQRIEWLPSGVPGHGQTYFEIHRLPAAPSYRVTVWDYYLKEGRGRGD